MVAITTLMNERAGLGAARRRSVSPNDLDELIELIKERGLGERPDRSASKIARLKIGIEACASARCAR